MSNEGVIYRISGPVVTATGMNAAMYDVVRVGHEGLMGEVIELHGDKAVIQVYEDTSGIRPGEQIHESMFAIHDSIIEKENYFVLISDIQLNKDYITTDEKDDYNLLFINLSIQK